MTFHDFSPVKCVPWAFLRISVNDLQHGKNNEAVESRMQRSNPKSHVLWLWDFFVRGCSEGITWFLRPDHHFQMLAAAAASEAAALEG